MQRLTTEQLNERKSVESGETLINGVTGRVSNLSCPFFFGLDELLHRNSKLFSIPDLYGAGSKE